MVTKALLETLSQVDETLCAIRSQPDDLRNDFYVTNNVGKHIRHILDHLQTFLCGLETGEINYDIRQRNSICEIDPDFAYAQLHAIRQKFEQVRLPATVLTVISEVDCHAKRSESFQSNASREVLYLINHTIHHVAYVRLLLRISNLSLPEHIGIAPCTASYMRQYAG